MMEHYEQGVIAIGFAVMLIVISQSISIVNCHGCTACSGLDVLNPFCQWAYETCAVGNAACTANSILVSEAFLAFGVPLLFYGILRIVV